MATKDRLLKLSEITENKRVTVGRGFLIWRVQSVKLPSGVVTVTRDDGWATIKQRVPIAALQAA